MNPAEPRFRMPAEWHTHERTLVAWPVRETMCEPDRYAPVCQAYADLVGALARFEPVTVLVNPGEKSLLEDRFHGLPVTVTQVPHDDSWIRDSGPTIVLDEAGNRSGVDWRFNAWGEKYPAWERDDRVAAAVLKSLGLPRRHAPLIMEGGSFHVDGQGTLLTTEECLLHPKRNPSLSREQIEEQLRAHLGIQKVIWLKYGLDGDETDGHVDNVACFAGPGTILIQTCTDPTDPNYARTQENLAVLHGETDAAGRPLRVVPIPQPPARMHGGQRLTLSYINFCLVNGGLLLPLFGGDAHEQDRSAEVLFRRIFPDRTLVLLEGTNLVREGGNLHCATQQIPMGGKRCP